MRRLESLENIRDHLSLIIGRKIAPNFFCCFILFKLVILDQMINLRITKKERNLFRDKSFFFLSFYFVIRSFMYF